MRNRDPRRRVDCGDRPDHFDGPRDRRPCRCDQCQRRGGDPRRHAGALVGLPGDTADVTTVRADQGGSSPDAARPGLFVGDAGLYARPISPSSAGRRPLHPGDADRPNEGDQGRGPPPSRALRQDHPQPSRQGGDRRPGGGAGAILCLNARRPRGRSAIASRSWTSCSSSSTVSQRSPEGCVPLASKRFGPYLSPTTGPPFIDRKSADRATRRQVRLTTNDDTLSPPTSPRLQGHMDHRSLLPQAEDHRARIPDVPLDARRIVAHVSSACWR